MASKNAFGSIPRTAAAAKQVVAQAKSIFGTFVGPQGVGTTQVEDLSITVAKLAADALAASAAGRGKMQAGFFGAGVAASQAHFADGFFEANATMRAKFADGIWTPAKLSTTAQTWTFNGADATGQINLEVTAGDARAYLGPTGAHATWLEGYSSAPTSAGKLKLVQDAIARFVIDGGRISIRTDGTAAAAAATDAVLDMQGVGALLVPRVTTTQQDALTYTNGMIIYNSTTGKLRCYAGGVLVDLH